MSSSFVSSFSRRFRYHMSTQARVARVYGDDNISHFVYVPRRNKNFALNYSLQSREYTIYLNHKATDTKAQHLWVLPDGTNTLFPIPLNAIPQQYGIRWRKSLLPGDIA